MPELSDTQRALAEVHGVSVEYVDWYGTLVAVPTETVLAVLASLGIRAEDPTDAASALAAHDRQRRLQALPACLVTTQSEPLEVTLRHGDAGDLSAAVELEIGGSLELTVSALPSSTRRGPADPRESTLSSAVPVPLGYHVLRARWPGGEATATLIVTPDFLGFPEHLGAERAWGLATQLYSVRSRESWGIGDLADLTRLVTWSGSDLGADYILVNPLSAAEPVAPMEPSPYLPSSRAFVNPVYLRIQEIPEYGDLPPAPRREVETLERDLHRALDQLDAIDRDACWAAKSSALRRIHQVPRSPKREEAYGSFLRQEGDALRDFATWCALTELHGPDWHEWPTGLRHPAGPQVQHFRAAEQDRVDFWCWLQWLLDDQLGHAQRAAIGAGMRMGVMHDLAVGVHPRGADAWVLQDVLAQGINVGAPPDAFTQLGQDWSQPPWRPDRLEALGYLPYRHLIARLLRHAGALRIDHIIGLFRLWCIPQGTSAAGGTYLRYDHRAMIGILALEAARAGAVVVGEDLGNVEPSAREYLLERGIIGTSILWFERDADHGPLPAEKWREFCLASVTTHDLPPTAGYLAGDHVELRGRLGLLTRPVELERAADEADRAAWLTHLEDRDLLAPGADLVQIIEGLHRYVARTPARLVCVALTDAVGDRRTQNQPGTSDEYPNWRVPLTGPNGEPLLLDDVVSSPRAARLAATVRSALHRR